MFTLISDTVNAIVGRAFSRSLWIDIEPATAPSEGLFSLVVRGRDKVLSGAAESTATDEADKKEHKPALLWNDASAETIPYPIALFVDKDSAETCAAQLLSFYEMAGEESPAPYTDRVGALGDDATSLLPVIMSMFGVRPNSEMLKPGRLGTFADFTAGTWRKRQPKAKAVMSPDEILSNAAALMRKLDSTESENAAMAKAFGISVDMLLSMKQVIAATV